MAMQQGIKDVDSEHDDFNKLLEEFLPMAENMLDEHDAFLPFGGIMHDDGEMQYIGVNIEGDHKPDVESVLTKVETALVGLIEDKPVRAVAVFMDTKISTSDHPDAKVDCIMARLEHKDAGALDTFRPYAKDPRGNYTYSTIFATDGEVRFFA